MQQRIKIVLVQENERLSEKVASKKMQTLVMLIFSELLRSDVREDVAITPRSK